MSEFSHLTCRTVCGPLIDRRPTVATFDEHFGRGLRSKTFQEGEDEGQKRSVHRCVNVAPPLGGVADLIIVSGRRCGTDGTLGCVVRVTVTRGE